MSTPTELVSDTIADVSNKNSQIQIEQKKSSSESTWKIHAVLIPKVNLSIQQHQIAIIRELSVENPFNKDIEDLTLHVRSSTEFMKSRSWTIDRIEALSSFRIQDLLLDLRPAFLSVIQSHLEVSLIFELSVGKEKIHEHQQSITLTPKNFWNGFLSYPELIAAHIHPENLLTQHLLKRSGTFLKDNGFSPRFSGYQHQSPKQILSLLYGVWMSIKALPYKLKEEKNDFESGTTLHEFSDLITTIEQERPISQIELSTLFCSCLEQIHLHPLLVFLKNQVYLGCWLAPNSHPLPVLDEFNHLQKSIAQKTFVLLDLSASSFDQAIVDGSDLIQTQTQFEIAINLQAARTSGIKPLEIPAVLDDALSENPLTLSGKFSLPISTSKLDIIKDQILEEYSAQKYNHQLLEPISSTTNRISHWKRKLLDLSLRNKLLNFSSPSKTSKSIPFKSDDFHRIPKLFDANKALYFSPQLTPNALAEKDSNETATSQKLPTTLNSEELEKHLTLLFRSAKSALQEGGSNILYLAAGFLEWSPSVTQNNLSHVNKTGAAKDDINTPTPVYRAPLVLIPVTLKRRSIKAGFLLEPFDDDPKFNPTLLEMLKQDFGITISDFEEELPYNDQDIDLNAIWSTLEHHIQGLDGWQIKKDWVLSTFSFAKYLMWSDLENNSESLQKNTIVDHLVRTPNEPFHAQNSALPDIKHLDNRYSPQDLHLPFAADSSQLRAVIAATEGVNFVLEGPPGTGKSQTIANIIANHLMRGKSVLFVSEKTAALDVVSRRLKEAHLSQYCLELHSNKTKKTDVIQQLKTALKTSEIRPSKEWSFKNSQLAKDRQTLNQYVQALHHQYPNGMSLYQALGVVIKHQDIPTLKFKAKNPEQLHREHYEKQKNLVQQMQNLLQELNIPALKDNALMHIQQEEWSPKWQEHLMETSRHFLNQTDQLATVYQQLSKLIPTDFCVTSFSHFKAYQAFIKAILNHSKIPLAFALEDNASETLKILHKASNHVTAYHTAWTQLSTSYRETVLDLDLPALREQWSHAQHRWFLSKWQQQRSAIQQLKHFTAYSHVPSPKEDLQFLCTAREHRQAIQQLENVHLLTEALGPFWKAHLSQPQVLVDALENATKLQSCMELLDSKPESRQTLKELLPKFSEKFQTDTKAHQIAKQYTMTLSEIEKQVVSLDILTANHSGSSFNEENFAQQATTVCSQWIESANKLRYWCTWRKQSAQAKALGLDALINVIEQSSDNLSLDLGLLFETNYCRTWVNSAIEHNPILKGFIPANHEQTIQSFQKLDDEIRSLTKQQIQYELSQRISQYCQNPQDPGWSVLTRELQKKKRHMPLRQMIESIPQALHTLKPCLLMSPLSVAQYLPADKMKFDLVIFDEASQIPVWDAIGSIARGRQAIIVGDSKQLPPTTFFERQQTSDFEDYQNIEDLESILDESIACQLPKLSLNWHYRSRHESLIQFSNQRYYDDSLMTFPSPSTANKAVCWHPVQGQYDKGGQRTNVIEAQAVVDQVFHFLNQENFKKSIGIVTFNNDQQTLIENLLDKKRRQYPDLENHFSDEHLEPVMVKNLESVQGDERDIILFSMTYGPDKTGKISMNFGPLNQSGGPRRLNVAITRARENLHVFSSLRPEDIDLTRTHAQGVADLKHFLDFSRECSLKASRQLENKEATSWSQALAITPSLTINSGPAFENAVMSQLSAKGWKLKRQIGVSSLKIDFAVVHPHDNSRYLAGIQCDGPSYALCKTARDRDILKKQVLTNLEWQVLTIWSLDWWTDSESAIERAHQQLTKWLKQNSKSNQKPIDQKENQQKDLKEEKTQTQTIATTSETLKQESPTQNTPSSQVKEKIEKTELATQEKELPEEISEETSKQTTSVKQEQATKIEELKLPRYRYFSMTAFEKKISQTKFHNQSYTPILQEMIDQFIKTEGPIRKDIFVNRLSKEHGFKRAGNRIQERIDALCQSYELTQEDSGEFLWPKHLKPSAVVFRKPPQGQNRHIDEIPIEELKSLVSQASIHAKDEEETLHSMAKMLGLKRVTHTTSAKLLGIIHQTKTTT